MKNKNTTKAGGSTATKMWTGWMDGWMGDTPQTVTTTRAPAVLKTIIHEFFGKPGSTL